jgi:hypothetical protein
MINGILMFNFKFSIHVLCLFPWHLHSQNCYTPGAQEGDSLLLCRLQWYMNNMLELSRNFSKSIKLLQGSRILRYMSIDR